MNIILESVSDPIWLVGAGTMVFATLILLLVVRSQDVRLADAQKQRATRIVLGIGLAAVLCLCSGVLLVHVQRASSPETTHHELASHQRSAATLTPSVEASPTATPKPSPTPRLARSITQVVTTFCDALASRDYQTAWQQYSSQLQQAHPQTETAAAWEKFTNCSIPDQSFDPSAWTIMTLTLADGQTERGRIGDVDYRATMTEENQTWKIAAVCQIMSEGCFPISWG
jgi:hypothetical protein